MDINPTYDNDVRCAEMIAQIAEDIRDKLAQTIQDAHYLSVLVDGDTGVSNTECDSSSRPADASACPCRNYNVKEQSIF